MNGSTLFAGLLFGAVGMGVFVYGKKQRKAWPFLIGTALMVYPYFFDDPWLLYGIGVVLIAALFMFRD